MIDPVLSSALDEISGDAAIASDDRRPDHIRLEAGKRTVARIGMLTAYVRLQDATIERLEFDNARLIEEKDRLTKESVADGTAAGTAIDALAGDGFSVRSRNTWGSFGSPVATVIERTPVPEASAVGLEPVATVVVDPIAEKVKSAASWLDGFRPGWASKVNLKTVGFCPYESGALYIHVKIKRSDIPEDHTLAFDNDNCRGCDSDRIRPHWLAEIDKRLKSTP